MAVYNNLPGIFLDVLDGQLTVYPDARAPKILILGTSDKEPAGTVYPVRVANSSVLKSSFGGEGTLYKTWAECNAAGGSNFVFWRLGSPDATKREIYQELFKAYIYMYDQPLDCVIPAGVYLDDKNIMDGDTESDGSALGRFGCKEVAGEWKFAWWHPDDPDDLASASFVSPSYTDLGTPEVITPTVYDSITGYATGPTIAEPMWSSVKNDGTTAMVPVFGNGAAGVTFTRKDTLNQLATVGDYHFSSQDGVLSIFAGTGLADLAAAKTALQADAAQDLTVDYSHWAGGVFDLNNLGLTRDDFHEVNFAYQLAEFCYRGSQVIDMRLGFIGVNEPGAGAAALATWVGSSSTTDAQGAITANGTGLLGNKFLSGQMASGGLPGYKSTAEYNGTGGFFATAEDANAKRCWLDGVEIKDSNGTKRDIGKYISIVASWMQYQVGADSAYNCSVAPAYGAYVQGGRLPTSSAPTNKGWSVGTLKTVLSAVKLDALAGKRIVGIHRKATKDVISDGVTAALPGSDYARVSTMRQVEAAVDGVRSVAEPFLGEGMTSTQIAGLNTAVSGALQNLVKNRAIAKFSHQIIVTPQMKILGQAIVQLTLVPAFELRQITVVVGLSAT